jgi:hypothetical protein
VKSRNGDVVFGKKIFSINDLKKVENHYCPYAIS